jgi:Sjoegren syndrome nuclear autoantigen 1
VTGIDELREKRDEITKMLQSEEEEKTNIQKDLVLLTKRLAEVDDSLSRKYAYINDYDRTIEDVEAAYGKVFTSFRSMLQTIYFYFKFLVSFYGSKLLELHLISPKFSKQYSECLKQSISS